MSSTIEYRSISTQTLRQMIVNFENDIARRAGARTKMKAQPGDLSKVIDDPVARAAMAHRIAASQADGLALFDKLDQEAVQAIVDIKLELKNRGAL